MNVEKVYAYITRGDHLLVFEHTQFPEAGIQVPGGSIEKGEDPEAAVLREAMEETGLKELKIQRYLGKSEYDLAEVGNEGIHLRHFFHLRYSGEITPRWKSYELNPSDGSPAPIEFEFYWVKFPGEVPELIAGQGDLLSEIRA